jgi:hypothetical protein
VLSAQHLSKFDHVDSSGTRYAAILEVPGADIAVELRLAPRAAQATAGYDPISFSVDSQRSVHDWADYLDTQHVEHSPSSPHWPARC